ncbi:MAG: aminoglycoside phosphotransferase family protein [Candidatus Nanopelagicaceae bacterium]|nr:aminoglycoside phosphotransferase family protein [Candidatus Nanopelagicaceae bacterium]
MSVELLNKDTVVKYLTDKKVISTSDKAEVEVLTGGVSNVVLAITTANQKLVLKQALAELAVTEKWLADQRRAIVEADAIKLFNQLSPDQVPKLIFLDPERFILVLERVPVGSTVWKSDLLAGVINPDVGASLGKTLATWHNYGEVTASAKIKFMEDKLFEQLRIDPFYRFVAAKNPQIEVAIRKLINELEGDKTTIVHGDFSPKNIMVSMHDQIYILDFEITHVGNPVFDLAFLIAHLLCKFFRTEDRLHAKLLSTTANIFTTEYARLRSISPSVAKHTALIALARVEGKSPVNYLDQVQQKKLQSFTKAVLADSSKLSVANLFEMSAK